MLLYKRKDYCLDNGGEKKKERNRSLKHKTQAYFLECLVALLVSIWSFLFPDIWMTYKLRAVDILYVVLHHCTFKFIEVKIFISDLWEKIYIFRYFLEKK